MAVTLTVPVYRLKRAARVLAQREGLALHAALDRLAVAEGFRSWSHLSAATARRPAELLLERLHPGEMMLLAARRGHGKTLLGLELLEAAAGAGRRGIFFTLEFTEAETLAALGTPATPPGFGIDTSDGITAGHVIERMGMAGASVAVIDYLQLLDQRRESPALEEQVAALGAHATATGAAIVLISQIDRRFETGGSAMPGLHDLRLPNPLDLTAFARAAFLHEGRLRLVEMG